MRFWLAGRSFPGKAKTTLLENALSFKLNFSEGLNEFTSTVEDGLHETDIKTFLALSKLPPQFKHMLAALAQELVVFAETKCPTKAYLQPNASVNSLGYLIKPA